MELAFEPWNTVEALTQARAAVQAAHSAYMTYLSQGSPFRGYESVLRRIATRLVRERSQSSWTLVMGDEMARAREDAAEDAQAQERVRLASEARAAEEDAAYAHAEEARRRVLEQQAALKACSSGRCRARRAAAGCREHARSRARACGTGGGWSSCRMRSRRRLLLSSSSTSGGPWPASQGQQARG